MVKRPSHLSRAVVTGALLLALGLTGCGSSTGVGRGAPTTDASPAVGSDLGGWLEDVCGNIGRVAAVANERNQLDWRDVSDPEAVAELIAHLERVESALDEGSAALDRTGAPPVEDREAVLSEIREAYRERSGAVRDAARFIGGSASRVDPLAVPQIAGAAQSAYTAAPRLARAVERQSELRDAYRANATCRGL